MPAAMDQTKNELVVLVCTVGGGVGAVTVGIASGSPLTHEQKPILEVNPEGHGKQHSSDVEQVPG